MTATQRATQILQAVTRPVTSFPDGVNEWLGKFPSTNGRIAATIFAMLGTAIRYWWSAKTCTPAGMCTATWEPSATWLAFLATMAGIDTAQFNLKRKTHTPSTSNQEAPPA
jgi:hypothetical protein